MHAHEYKTHPSVLFFPLLNRTSKLIMIKKIRPNLIIKMAKVNRKSSHSKILKGDN